MTSFKRVASVNQFLFLFCFFSVLPLLFDNACLPDHFVSLGDNSDQRRALRYISRHATANSLFTTHMITYDKSTSIATQKTVCSFTISVMATIIFSKRGGNVVSGVVVWPNQLRGSSLWDTIKGTRIHIYNATKMLLILNENYLLFLPVKNLTAIARLDNAKTINVSKSSQ